MGPTLRRAIVAGIASALVAPLASCRMARPVPVAGAEPAADSAGATPAARPATVVVVNKSTYPVAVYVLQAGGVPWRLGEVASGATADYTLDPSYFANGRLDLMAQPRGFVASQTGGTGAVRPGSVVVWGRRIVTLTIQPDIYASTVRVE